MIDVAQSGGEMVVQNERGALGTSSPATINRAPASKHPFQGVSNSPYECGEASALEQSAGLH